MSVIFSRFGEDSFFLPVAFAAGSTRPLRDINYIFQRWMLFRNKNPLNMSNSCKLLIPFSKKKKEEQKLPEILSKLVVFLFDKFPLSTSCLVSLCTAEKLSPYFTLPNTFKNKFNIGVFRNCRVQLHLMASLESQSTIKIIEELFTSNLFVNILSL